MEAGSQGAFWLENGVVVGSSPFADGPGPAAVYFAFRFGAWLAEHAPKRLAESAAALAGRIAYRWAKGKRAVVEKNLQRVVGPGEHLEQVVRDAFDSYARYWLETFRLGRYSDDELLSMVEPVDGTVSIMQEALDEGKGVLLITPHLGFYDLGVAWVGLQGWQFTTVAEVLRPRALFEWFAQIRQRYGMKVEPARNGRSVRERLADVLDRGEGVALVSDRDLGRRGIWVEFFGEETTFPASPALLLVRKKIPLIAGSVIQSGPGYRVRFERIDYELTGDESADVPAVAQVTADALERFIREAPDQWHLFSRNWPSDEPDLPPRGRREPAESDPGEPPAA